MDKYFADRIDDLCKKRGITIKELERTLGFANGYIRNVSRKGFKPKIDRLNLLSEYFGVSPEYLLGEQVPIESGTTASDGVIIPVLGKVAAGIPITAVENVIGQEEISKKLAASGEYFALKIKGDSMAPYIMDGDIVVVRQQDDAETDEIVIAIIDGQDGVCKKLKKSKNAVTLVSINPNYDPIVFTNDEVDSIPVKIIGKVVEIRRTV